MSSNITYLITGANRGLGRGLLATYLSRPNSTVIAAVRDPLDSTVTSFDDLPHGPSSKLHVVKLDSASPSDAETAIQTIQKEYSIAHLDVVIANAAIGKTYDQVSALTCVGITIDDMYEHFTVNTIGPLLLFRACLPLMEKSAQPKFVIMSSFAASLAAMHDCPFPNAAYGPSKAGVNYLARKMHFEHENLITFALNPGWVRTAMGNAGAQMFGMKEAALTPEESVGGLVSVIDQATRETTSGKFMEHTGGELPCDRIIADTATSNA